MNPLRDVQAALGTLRPADWSVLALSGVAAVGVLGVGVTVGWLSQTVTSPPVVAGPRPAPPPEQVELPRDPVADLPERVVAAEPDRGTGRFVPAVSGSDADRRMAQAGSSPVSRTPSDEGGGQPPRQQPEPPQDGPPPQGPDSPPDSPPDGPGGDDPPADEPLAQVCVDPVLCVDVNSPLGEGVL